MVSPAFQPPTQYVFYAVYAVWVLPEVLSSVRSSTDDGPNDDANSIYAVYAAIGVAVVGGLAFGITSPSWAGLGSYTAPMFWLGCLLMLVGTGVRWYSVSVLGAAFSRRVEVHRGQDVVEAGPYGVVRHPTYTGSLTTLLGFGLACGTWPSVLVALLAGLLGYGFRIHVEERALRETLDGYREYCRRVRYRLVPGIY
jgi:protein-S-isoprenylcysteine O-methyltransferase Ste14